MPPRFATHSRAQEFYFGENLLLRRQDYTLDIADGFRAANFATDHVEAEGLTFATRRRAYMCDKRWDVLRDRLMIWIGFARVAVE